MIDNDAPPPAATNDARFTSDMPCFNMVFRCKNTEGDLINLHVHYPGGGFIQTGAHSFRKGNILYTIAPVAAVVKEGVNEKDVPEASVAQ